MARSRTTEFFIGLVRGKETVTPTTKKPSNSSMRKEPLDDFAQRALDKRLLDALLVPGGDFEAAKKALVDGASKDARDENRATTLMLAAKSGNRDLIELFLSQGVDPNAKDARGNTAIMYAILGSKHVDIIGILIGARAEKNAQNNDGMTALALAAKTNNLKGAMVLTAFEADVNIPDNLGCTPLMMAAQEGNFEFAKYLISKGAKIDVKDKSRKNVLMHAAIGGNVGIADLVADDVELEERDNDGRTALAHAVINKKREMINYLVIAGADVHGKDNAHKTILMHAIAAGDGPTINFLKKHGAHADEDTSLLDGLLLEAFHEPDREKMKAKITDALERGANVDARVANGMTSLMSAAFEGDEEVVELILKYKPDVNAKDGDGTSVLMYAAHGGNVKILERLVELGAEVNDKSNDDSTPLMFAIRAEKVEAAAFLVGKGADRYAERQGVTAVRMAVGNPKMFEALKNK
ncbi:MAG: ankyrin repeat domain-containing protein [Candidatus Micrarchaeota archaeon]